MRFFLTSFFLLYYASTVIADDSASQIQSAMQEAFSIREASLNQSADFENFKQEYIARINSIKKNTEMLNKEASLLVEKTQKNKEAFLKDSEKIDAYNARIDSIDSSLDAIIAQLNSCSTQFAFPLNKEFSKKIEELNNVYPNKCESILAKIKILNFLSEKIKIAEVTSEQINEKKYKILRIGANSSFAYDAKNIGKVVNNEIQECGGDVVKAISILEGTTVPDSVLLPINK